MSVYSQKIAKKTKKIFLGAISDSYESSLQVLSKKPVFWSTRIQTSPAEPLGQI